MPPRKKAKVANDDKILTKKLMQLSLRVDDHIYKNKRISVADATDFLRELASLKEQIKKSIRLSQVAEKLTREMRGIIAEEQDAIDALHIDHQDLYKEHFSSNPQSYNNEPEIAHLTKNGTQKVKAAIPNENTKIQNDIETVYISDDEDLHINNSVPKTNGIYCANRADEEIDADISTQLSNLTMQVDADNFTQLSNLTMQVIDNTPILSNCDSAYDNCSPSVLKNYGKDDDKGQKEIYQPGNGTNSKFAASTKNIDHQYAVPNMIDNTAMMTIVPISSKPTNVNRKSKTGRKTKNISSKKRVAKKPERFSPAQNDSLYKSKQTFNTQKEMKQKKIETVIKQMNKFEEIKVQKKSIKTDSAKPDHAPDIQAKKMPSTIDLSWIDGIKYVRIIDESEYIPSHESVWDNCEFPQNWDERDFDYY